MIFCTRYIEKGSGQFVGISVELIEIMYDIFSWAEIGILIFVAKNERDRNHRTNVSVSYIAEGTNCSTATARKAMQKFKKYELIEVGEDGKYYMKQHTTESFLKVVAKNATPSSSNNYQGSLVKNATEPEQKMLGREEQKTSSSSEEGGKKGHLPFSERVQGRNLFFLPDPINCPVPRIDGDTQDPLLNCQSKWVLEQRNAKKSKNPILGRSFFMDFNRDMPRGLEPDFCVEGQESLFSRTVLLTATNIMVHVSKSVGESFPILPTTMSDVNSLSDVLVSFLSSDFGSWEQDYENFYTWCLENKPNLSINLLGMYLGDWQADVPSRRWG